MPDTFQDAFADVLAEFGESVSYILAGAESASSTSLTAVVRREKPEIDRSDSTRKIFRCTLQVANLAHATYGGFTSEPAVNAKWSVKINPGDSAATNGWKAGVAQAARGKWMIPLTLVPDRIDVGGHGKTAIGARV